MGPAVYRIAVENAPPSGTRARTAVVMALMPEGNAAACVALASRATILSSKISVLGLFNRE